MKTGAMSSGTLSAAVCEVISTFGVRQRLLLKDVQHRAGDPAGL
jgi:hypothetical protein